jgi:predicted GNAT family acetyltransferase
MSAAPPEPAGSPDAVVVREDPARHRFEVWVGEQRAGVAVYVDHGDGVVAFTHTEVDPRFEHQGLAGRLVAEALATARRRSWAVLPECPYVRAYLKRNPELVDLVPEERRAGFGLRPS